MGSAVVVHDDESVRQVARLALEGAGFSVVDFAKPGAALRTIEFQRSEVILLSWISYSETSELLQRLRERDSSRESRILVLVPQARIRDAVVVLELGADDCIALPLDSSELVARVSAALRRPFALTSDDSLYAGPLALNKSLHQLLVKGCAVSLSPTEFRLLAFLMEHPGRLFSRAELLRRAWLKDTTAGRRTVDVHVRRLRQLLEPHGCHDLIQTVRGFGYRLARSLSHRPEATTTE